jgi:L,D-transpeptidase ErfK/SrfK
LFAKVPDGTPVRVVNQPFLFGWHDQQLYLQPYTVLEDDPRDWKSAQRKLLSHSLPARIQSTLQGRGERISWQSVDAVTSAPRGIPVAVSGHGDDSGGSVEQVLSGAPEVENRIPEGSNWDGVEDSSTDGQSAQQMLPERASAHVPPPASHAPGG